MSKLKETSNAATKEGILWRRDSKLTNVIRAEFRRPRAFLFSLNPDALEAELEAESEIAFWIRELRTVLTSRVRDEIFLFQANRSQDQARENQVAYQKWLHWIDDISFTRGEVEVDNQVYPWGITLILTPPVGIRSFVDAQAASDWLLDQVNGGLESWTTGK